MYWNFSTNTYWTKQQTAQQAVIQQNYSLRTFSSIVRLTNMNCLHPKLYAPLSEGIQVGTHAEQQ